jgi:hypothetical protein
VDDGLASSSAGGPAVVALSGLVLTCLLMPSAAFAHSAGIFNYSGKNGGVMCNQCHSGGMAPNVQITGPATLEENAVATYTVTITGGAAVVGGVDIAESDGGVAILMPGPGMRVSNNELTHITPKAFSNGTATFNFQVQAGPAPGSFTLFAAGLSANNSMDNTGDMSAENTLMISVTAPAPPMDAGSPPPPPPPDAGNPNPDPMNDDGSDPSMSTDPYALSGGIAEGGCSATGLAPAALLGLVSVLGARRRRAD